MWRVGQQNYEVVTEKGTTINVGTANAAKDIVEAHNHVLQEKEQQAGEPDQAEEAEQDTSEPELPHAPGEDE